MIPLHLLVSQVISFFPLYIHHSHNQFICFVFDCKMGNSQASRGNLTRVQQLTPSAS